MRLITLLILVVLVNPGYLYAKTYVDEIRIFIPAFSGPDDIGINASTFLNLQLFKTLRRRPTEKFSELDFGHGTIIWSADGLSDQKHQEAEALMQEWDLLAQIGLWGKVWHYGDGLIVQAYLSLPKYEDYRETVFDVWSKDLSIDGKSYSFRVDIPRRRVMFAPFYLSKTFVRKFRNPLTISMLAMPISEADEVGRLGSKIRALKFEGNWVKVRSQRKEGWVEIPAYSEEKTEVVDFVAAIIRVFRGDWKGAYHMLETVVENPNTPTSIKIDTLLIQTRMLDELGESSRGELIEALNLSPFSHKVAAYKLMWHISKLKTALEKGRKVDAMKESKEIELFLKDKEYLFTSGDPFIHEIKRLISDLGKEEI